MNLKQILTKTKDILRTTPAEIYLVAALGAFSAGSLSYNYEARRASLIPLNFTEITEIEREAELKGEKVGPITRYLATASDAPNKVFECYNHSHNVFGQFDRKKFAAELEMRMDLAYKIHPESLKELLGAMSTQADSCLSELQKMHLIKERLVPLHSSLETAWKENHDDIYLPTVHTSVDEDGNVHTYVTMDYDHTNHTFQINRPFARQSIRELETLLTEFQQPDFNEKIRTTRVTNAEGEAAAKESRRKNSPATQKELLNLANLFYYGSTLAANLPEIKARWISLKNSSIELPIAENSASDEEYFYRTGSHSHPGPEEFQANERAREHTEVLHERLKRVFDGINYNKEASKELEAKINALISVELDNGDGNGRRLSSEIINLAKTMYELNFEDGSDTPLIRWELIVMLSFVGLGFGAAAGYGLDLLGDRYNWYGKR